MPQPLPLFPLNTALVPGLMLPLHIFEPRYRQMIEDLLAIPDPSERQFAVIGIRDGRSVQSQGIDALYSVGVTAHLQQAERLPDGRFDIMTTGYRRFRLLSIDTSAPLIEAEIEFLDDPEVIVDPQLTSDVSRAFAAYREILSLGTDDLDILNEHLRDDPTTVSYVIAASLVLPPAERQRLLEAPDALVRLQLERALLIREHALISALGAVPAIDPILTAPSAN